jgi:hypothetical protein
VELEEASLPNLGVEVKRRIKGKSKVKVSCKGLLAMCGIECKPTTTTNFANTTSPKEPDAVDQLCSVANNTVFMTPLRNAVDAVAVPAGSNFTRETEILDPTIAVHILQVRYRDTIDDRVVRVANILPPMANWCP